MNNNNLYNINSWIGTTHQDFFHNSSNNLYFYTSNTSNILSNQIIITSNILENDILITSNILEINSSNKTSNLRYDINKLIKEETEHISLPIPYDKTHTYIYNSNVVGEIRFWCKSTTDFPIINPLGVPDYRTKIDVDGKLKVYYTYDPLISLTFGNGWIDIANSIVNLNSADANFVITITGIQAEINNNYNLLEQQIIYLIYALEDYTLMTQSQRIQVMNAVRNQAEFVRIGQQSMPLALSSIREAAFTGIGGYITTGINIATARIVNNPFTASFLGATGAVFYFLANKIYEQEYNSRTLGLMYSNVSNMVGITENTRNELYSNIGDERIRSLINITSNEYNINLIQGFTNSNIITTQYLNSINTNELKLNQTNISNIFVASNVLSNINLNQGFINSNITNQQYISNLKCDNLILNNGNISNINGISTNELIASGKIKQNNILLDNTYLNSNHLYNLAFNYTAERQYPSKLFTSSSIEGTTTLLNKLVYKQTLFLDTSSISYGSGFYEVFSSSTYDNGITNKDKLFNFNTVETTNSPRWFINLYNSGTGNYQGDNSIDGIYYGDWVILKLPQEILLTKYRIYQRSDFLTKAPAEWKCYGSKDGIIFNQITEAHQLTRLTSYTSGFYEKSLASTFTTQYQYIGFVFNKLLSTSGQTDLSFAELQIFGKEIISNSIVSNIYSTSNAVKYITEFDMPILGKHYGFYITINTAININGSTYYKYDIDLRKYTQLGTIQIGPQSGDTFRSFKIRVMYATMFFSYIINDLPNVCYYEVFMSYKNTASPPNGSAGLNCCAIGYPPNTTLQTIMPNNLFVIKNGTGSINYITVISTNQSDCRCIIEDLIG